MLRAYLVLKIIPGGTIWDMGIKHRYAVCKANALPSVLLLQHTA